MRSVISILSWILLIFLAGCGEREKPIKCLEDLANQKTFAVPTGTAADQMVLKKFPEAKIEYYNSAFDCALAVGEGKADAAVYDLPVLKNIAASQEGLTVLPELLFDDNYGFAVRMEDQELKNAIDTVLARLKAGGGYEEILKRWLPDKGEPGPMPDLPLTGGKGVLRFGTAAITEPISYMDANRRITGFDIEFVTRVAQYLGKTLEISDMEFGAMIPALIAGKVDMIGAGLSITEERAKKVLFSEPYFKSGIAAIVRSSDEAAGAALMMDSLTDIADKRIGVLLGSIHDTYATRTFPAATILQFQNLPDMLFALNSGKIDAAFFDQSSLREIYKVNPSLAPLAENVFSVDIGAGFNSENDSLRLQFNRFLHEIRENGVYQDMVGRWMEQGVTEMPEIRGSVVNGTLRNGVVSDIGMPFTIMQEGKLVGFDIELSSRFAAWCGKSYEPVDLQFGSLIASVTTNKIDLITSSMMITEEREKQIDFSDPYHHSGVTVIARKENIARFANETETTAKSFFDKIGESFYSNIIHEKRYLHILNGLKVTMIISILAALLGTLIGAGICYLRMSANTWLSSFARGYISLLRGLPVLVLLMIIYYVVFASVNINPIVVSVIAFGLNFGAYVSEIFRTSIESIDRGQREAAIAGGFTKVQTFRYIILPQSIPYILPVYKGEFISLIKMTSIVGYIAVQDLTKASDIIRSRTFDAFFPLIMVAVLYLFIAWLLTRLLDRIEVTWDPRHKRKNRKEATR